MSLPLITPERIRDWGANDSNADRVLPELIRRLIQTSNQAITRLEVASGKQVAQGGYDGIVEAGPYLGAGGPFVPVGWSVWELGAQGDPLAKLKSDYKKRTAAPGSLVIPAETTFVLVTHHILTPTIRTWAEKTRNDPASPWRHLEVYGAAELRDWLEVSPAVAVWFGTTHLGIPSGLMSLEQALEHLAARTSQRISPHILLPERDAEAAAVRRWAEAALDEPGGRALTLQATSEEEALAFVCAVLDDERPLNPHRATFHARTLIATTRAAWEHVLSERVLSEQVPNKPPGVRLLLPMPGVAPSTPGERRVHVLLPTTPPNGAEVVLPPMSISAFAGGLVHKADLGVDDANTCAVQSNRTWEGLVRLAGLNSTPPWLTEAPRGALVVALLLGSWSDENDTDRALIAQLTGQPYASFTDALEPLLHLPDPPLLRDTSGFSRCGWSWVHRGEAWRWLERDITSDGLERFSKASVEALLIPAPQTLGTTKELLERYQRGDYPPAAASNALRAGIFEAMRWLAEASAPDKQRAIWSWVRALLEPPQQTAVWLTLGQHLNDLATLNGEGFLKATRQLLKLQATRRDELLQSHALLDALVGLALREPTRSSAIIELLWTLEGLEPTPEPERPKQTTQRLAELLLRLDATQQHAALQRLRQEDPKRVWTIRIQLGTRPEGQLWTLIDRAEGDAERQRRWTVGVEALQANADALILQAQEEPMRWPELLEHLDDLFWLNRSDPLAAALEEACAGPLEEAQRDAIAWALRQTLHTMLYSLEDERCQVVQDAPATPLYEQLLDLYKRLVPDEFKEGGDVPVAWLFRRGVLDSPIPQPQEERYDFKKLDARQEASIQRLLHAPEALKAIVQLCTETETAYHRDILSYAAKHLPDDLEPSFLAFDWSPEQRAWLLRALAERHKAPHPRWLTEHVEGFDAETRARILGQLPITPEQLDLIAALPPEQERHAWQALKCRPLDTALVERAVSRLMDLGLPLEALSWLIPLRTQGLAAPQLPTPTLHQLFEEAGDAWMASIPPDSSKERYHPDLSLLHNTLLRRADRDTARLIQAEQRLVRSLADTLRSPGHALAFFETLASSASTTAALLLAPYDPDARRILNLWGAWLSRQPTAPIPQLEGWLTSVLQQIEREAESPRWIARKLARLLAQLPVAPEDGIWPALALREALEGDLPLKDELIEGFRTPDLGRSARPRVYSIEEGGVHAEQEVKHRQEWIDKLAYSWPTAAEAVQMSLSYWSGELKRRDRDAELLRQRRFYSLTDAQEGHLTLKQAQDAGIAEQLPAMLEAGVLQRVGPGVYRLTRVDPGEEAHLLALWLRFNREGVFSHGTALGLLNISDYAPFQVELTLPTRWEALKVRLPPNTRLYYADLPSAERAWQGSVPVTTAARTLEDCARVHIATDLLRQAVQEGLHKRLFTREEIPITCDTLKRFEEEMSLWQPSDAPTPTPGASGTPLMTGSAAKHKKAG